MTVTVIIVNYNSGLLLKKCLDCLMKQTMKPDKTIVVDNASSDKSPEIISEFSDVELIALDKNVGFAAGNNIALRKCETTHAALLNPDAFADPYWLESLMEFMSQNPSYSALASKQICFDNKDLLDGIGDCCNLGGLVWRDGYSKKVSEQGYEAKEIFSPCAAAAIYDVQSIKECDYFDEDFFCYCEDIDLGFRLRLLGYRSAYVPTAIVAHVGSAISGGSHSAFSIYYGHRNLVWNFFKNMPGPLLWILLPIHIFINVISCLYFICTGHGKTIIKAKIDALIKLPEIFKKRKKIQNKRRVSVKNIWKVLDKSIFPKK